MSFANIFFQTSIDLLFPLTVSFTEQVYDFCKLHHINFFLLWIMLLMLILRNLCLIQGYKIFNVSPKSFIFWGLHFRSMAYSILIFIWCELWVESLLRVFLFFCICMSHILIWLSFFCWVVFTFLFKINWSYMCGSVSRIYSVPLNYMAILSPILYHRDLYHFLVSLEIRWYNSFNLFTLKNYFDHSSSFVYLYKF